MQENIDYNMSLSEERFINSTVRREVKSWRDDFFSSPKGSVMHQEEIILVKILSGK